MITILVTLLALICVTVLIYPFIARNTRPGSEEGPVEQLTQQLRRARERTYEEIRVLQQEYFLENLTEEEYREQLQAARLRAAQLLRQQQQVQETVAAINASVEEELQRAWTAAPGPPSSEGRLDGTEPRP